MHNNGLLIIRAIITYKNTVQCASVSYFSLQAHNLCPESSIHPHTTRFRQVPLQLMFFPILPALSTTKLSILGNAKKLRTLTGQEIFWRKYSMFDSNHQLACKRNLLLSSFKLNECTQFG